jgi:hypothetical protein
MIIALQWVQVLWDKNLESSHSRNNNVFGGLSINQTFAM